MTQQEALTIMKSGVNVYLTGSAGSGKTHTLREYIKWLNEHDIPVAITASTGIAATHMNGQTIHGFAGIGIRESLNEYDLEQIEQKSYLWKRFEKTKVLIIDEVSMLHAHRLDMVEMVCRRFKRNDLPFGGIQVILSGDFFQLPPVSKGEGRTIQRKSLHAQNDLFIDYDSGEMKEEAPESDMIIHSRAWRVMKPAICYLTEQHRQEDDFFLEILNAIRRNDISPKHKEAVMMRMDASVNTALPTKLYTHNVDVDGINFAELQKLNTPNKEFVMSGKGNPNLIESLKKSCLAPEVLSLKEGAEVMFIKNNYEEGYVNGTRGKIVGFDARGEPVVEIYSSGRRLTVSAVEWSVEENNKPKATIIQYPLRLAWAITIHKSQGLSLDSAEIDLGKTFAYGMGYVALSRVRKLSGVRLVGFSDNALMVDPEVLKLDEKLQKESEENSALFGRLSEGEKTKIEEQFILKMGGKVYKSKVEKEESKEKSKSKSKKEPSPEWAEKMAELRKKHPNAYTPWKDEDDETLIEKFKNGGTIPQISKILGRQVGSIKARLIMHELIEDDNPKAKA